MEYLNRVYNAGMSVVGFEMKSPTESGSMADTGNLYMGIDVGSVSTNLVIIDHDEKIKDKLYLRTGGQPINAMKEGLQIFSSVFDDSSIAGVGTTGSGRQLASVISGADIVKNEITAHAIAAQHIVPDVRTIIEIGGQDSKIILLKDGVVYDFAMNTVCAAGTGSFLDRQAGRLNIPIEEFGSYALRSTCPVRIAGRCAVFAESDMIHKQQTGHTMEDIIRGLCDALVRNYLSNLAKGKDIEEPVVFQGGVAANVGIAAAFEKALGMRVIIPENHDVMGAFGAALLAKEKVTSRNMKSAFRGFACASGDYRAVSRECKDCPNACEIVEIVSGKQPLARWGDRCGKHSAALH